MTDQFSGNKNVSGDFLRVLLALKQNIFKDMCVADVCQVVSDNGDGTWICTSISTNQSAQAVPLKDLIVAANDVVVVLFADQAFITNLTKIKQGQKPQTITDAVLHTKAGAIILGILYTTRT